MPWTDSLRRTRSGPDDVRGSVRVVRSGGAVRRRCGPRWCVARVVAFVVDQLGEPADLAVDRVQAVALQFERVAVQLLLGAPQRVEEPVALALDRAPAALEDPQPHVCGGVPEERQ